MIGDRMSIRSMTAFASAEGQTEAGRLTCELRAVNHRFLEIGFRLPEELRALEPQMRERIAARVSRGKIEVSMRLSGQQAGPSLFHMLEVMGKERVLQRIDRTLAKFNA